MYPLPCLIGLNAQGIQLSLRSNSAATDFPASEGKKTKNRRGRKVPWVVMPITSKEGAPLRAKDEYVTEINDLLNESVSTNAVRNEINTLFHSGKLPRVRPKIALG
ncbi:hypothetical protein AVEN_193927-1 [Araneus ventricosus]|uniref:Uncharacterized protein n=1 Tax=Araneus ventricosus TaxID=182803 RepID=A0A4Y2JU26_ARAVE|nr:hypothetical protein AVEN_193927-1 [Araneus ventricosus]